MRPRSARVPSTLLREEGWLARRARRAEVEEVLCVHAPGRPMRRLPLRRTLLALALLALTTVGAGFALGYALRAQLHASRGWSDALAHREQSRGVTLQGEA
jgi:hypothetical protein